MKNTIVGFIIAIAIVAVLFGFKHSAKNEVLNKHYNTGVFEPVAVVELFTSQDLMKEN